MSGKHSRSRLKRGGQALSLALLVVLGGASGCGSGLRPWHSNGPRPGPPVALGVNSDITWGIPKADVSREVGLIARSGMTWVLASVDLSGVEPTRPGRLSHAYLRQIDRAVRLARAAKLNVLLELDRAPYWASADPHKYTNRTGQHWNPYWEYRDPRAYARIVLAMVKRYRRMGVSAFEIWNEPNYPQFWPSGVRASAYVKLLAVTYPAIKRVDPGATVVMAGLSNLGASRYLDKLYTAGVRGLYDVANFHLYPNGDPRDCAKGPGGRPASTSFCLLDTLRAEMNFNHDQAPVWITELGWASCGQDNCVTRQEQARYLISAYRLLADASYSFVKSLFIYAMRDLAHPIPRNGWANSLGLVTRTFVPKPAYQAVKRLAERIRGTNARAVSTSR